jgi:hypothetical protein
VDFTTADLEALAVEEEIGVADGEGVGGGGSGSLGAGGGGEEGGREEGCEEEGMGGHRWSFARKYGLGIVGFARNNVKEAHKYAGKDFM